jgi:Holliday junction resolvase
MGGCYNKGYMYEVALVRLLNACGLRAIRTPHSGQVSGFDVIAVGGGRAVAFEVKHITKPRTVTLTETELNRFREFCTTAKVPCFIAIHVSYLGWRLIPLETVVERTVTRDAVLNAQELNCETILSILKSSEDCSKSSPQ